MFQKEKGFSEVIQCIQKSKKPLVGHNNAFDIFFLYNQFYDRLPETYVEFVQKWKELFPTIYDSKVLAKEK